MKKISNSPFSIDNSLFTMDYAVPLSKKYTVKAGMKHLPLNGSCLYKKSCIINCKKMYIKRAFKNTKSNKIEEVVNMLAPKAELLNITIPQEEELFIEKFLTHEDHIKDKSKIKFVIRTCKQVSKGLIGNENFLNIICNLDFISGVLEILYKRKSFDILKCTIKRLYLFYFDQKNFPPLNPHRQSIIQTITMFGRKPKKKWRSIRTPHPLVAVYLLYISEKNQKWQKNARVSLVMFLNWLILNEYFVGKNYLQIEVMEISYKILSDYRDYLQSKIIDRKITRESAQNYIRYIKNWFKFLKQKGEIAINPTTKLKNFRVKKTKGVTKLFSMEELDRFFNVILSSNEPLKWFLIFSILATLGLRANEVLGLNRGDINLRTGELLVRRKHHKEQTLPLPSLTWLLLKKYMESFVGVDSDPLWLNQIGVRVRYHTLREHYHRFIKDAGIRNKSRALHNFRHLLLSELCLENPNLEKLKVLADVKFIQTLDTYIHARQASVTHEFNLKFKPVGVDR